MIATKFYLDSRKTKDGCPAPLMITISIKRETAYLNTGIRILPDQWNARAMQAKSRTVQRRADDVMYAVNTLLSQLTADGRLDGMTAKEIRDEIRRRLSPAEARPVYFLDVLEQFALSRPRPRTTEIYYATKGRILAFDKNAGALRFEDINIGWLDRFDTFLASTSPKKNARNIHFRNIRAVFNYALKRGVTSLYPFRQYEIRPEATMKRALTVEQLRTLFTADVKPWQQKYVDFFKMSFLLIGINTEDLTHATGINGGRLEYERAKTHRPYSIKVEPECQELIDKYRGRSYLLNVMDTYAKTAHWTSKVNNELQDIAKSLGLPKISMYWARHTWATLAAELDIPKETITAALGQSSNTVTDIYIRFDRTKIDRANRKVLDYALYDKKEQDMFEMIRQLNETVTASMARRAN